MNQAIAAIIRGHIEDLDFIDKIAGLVTPITFEVKAKDNTTVNKTFPVACCVTPEECGREGAYYDLMPNSAYKTVLYFEDRGVSFEKAQGNFKYYTSNLRLVCWINIEKLTESGICKTDNPCTYAAHLVAEIIRNLPEHPQHIAPFSTVYSEVVEQYVRSANIFSAYTYDEKHSQYLMAPFDFFALDIKTTFAICLRENLVYNPICGVQQSSV